VPVGAGLLQGERPSALQVAGIAVAVAGVILAARAPAAATRRVTPAAVALALVAAAGLGGGTVALDAASEHDVMWGTLALRTILFALVAGAALATRPPLAIGLAQIAALAGIGILDTAANVAFAEATTRGLLSIVGVLGQLYPVVVILLARFSLDERLAPNQLAGVGLALSGVGVIAAA
jgi:drug/metabolite transporter (DMT)-like permease